MKWPDGGPKFLPDIFPDNIKWKSVQAEKKTCVITFEAALNDLVSKKVEEFRVMPLVQVTFYTFT